MAGKKWSASEDNFIRANRAVLSAKEIAERLGRTESAIHHRREVLGLPKIEPETTGKLQSKRWNADLEARIGEPICSYLTRRYVTEQASYREITAELGINTRPLMRLMRECGITPISPQEAVSRQLKNNPDFLKPFIDGGQKREARLKTALIRQQTLSHMSDEESRFLDVLHSKGLNPVPQMAVDAYNIDFAFPNEMLAVEWDARWHRSPRKRPTDRTRDQKLTEWGWFVLRLDPRTSDETNVKKVSEALKERASIQPR